MNLFELKYRNTDEEIIERLIPDKGVLIERIVTTGQASPPGFWYDQERDEWVAVLQGNAKLAWDNGETVELVQGDWILIPAHRKHRVEWASSEPPCIWLAVHGKLL